MCKFLGELGLMRVHQVWGGMAPGTGSGDSPHGEPQMGGKVGSGRLLVPPATAAVPSGAQLLGWDGAKPSSTGFSPSQLSAGAPPCTHHLPTAKPGGLLHVS